MVAFSFVGDPEALEVKPGVLGSGAGFQQPGRAAPAAHPHAVAPHPPVPGPGCFRLCCQDWSADWALRQAPPPHHSRRCLPGQGKSPPPFPVRTRAAGTYLGPPGPLERTRREPRSGQSSSRGHRALRAGTAAKWIRGADGPRPKALLPRHLGPPPRPGLPFPPGREWVRGGGSPSGISNRHRRPPLAAVRLGEGRVPGCWLLSFPEGLRAPAKRRAPGAEKGTWIAQTRGLGLDRARATGGGVVPGGAAWEESRRATRWLGLDYCTFFFVRWIFRNKKKSPTLHTASSASLRTRGPATAAWGDGDDCPPRTPQPGVGGTGARAAPAAAQSKQLTTAPTHTLHLCISLQALGRTLATQFKVSF